VRKKTRTRTRGWLVLALAVAGAGCSETAGLDAIDDGALRDLAIVAADETLEEVNTFAQPFGFGPLGEGPGAGRPGGRHGFGAEGSGTTSRTFYDAEGALQDEYDELSTARIEVETIVDGGVSRDGWTASVYRERLMTITGLEGEETHRTMNGAGVSETTRSRHTDEGDRTYEMSGSFTMTDVVVPIPGSEPRYPVSGTVTRTMSGTRTDADGTESRSMEMTVTFDGDETAVAIVNGEEYEIDLSARSGGRPWGRRGPGR
jgi:hypothetical protein